VDRVARLLDIPFCVAGGIRTVYDADQVLNRSAGEIVLNCMNQDGVKKGYDCGQLARVRAATTLPLIASGGAGAIGHFEDVFRRSNVNGALAASVFHSGAIPIGALKRALASAGIVMRLPTVEPVVVNNKENRHEPRNKY